MSDVFRTVLFMTGAGMLIVFLALVLLSGLMMLLTAVTRDRPAPETSEPPPAVDQRALRARAALVAVALARARKEAGPGLRGARSDTWSPWRQFHTQRVLQGTVEKRSIR
jgi:Na+-transporting methylmalonyl-CoA/oxaloacetate decarboxylase gamma subunit